MAGEPVPGTAGVPAAATSDGVALAWVGTIAVAVVAVLLVLSPLYGFHRDELYFIVAGRHPALGYADQPSLTPLLSAGAVALLGVSPTAIRILPALSMGVLIVLAGLTARDLGGSRRAQALAALVLALSGFLAAGHLDSTATFDLLAWGLILWLLVRLLAGADPRLWIVLGVVAGIDLENKDIILFLAAGIAAGLLLARRWEVIRSPWAWGAVAIAGIIWLPNLAWQAANGWPQLEMARSIAGNADENRGKLLVELLLLAGPLLFPVTLVGAWWLLRSPGARAWRTIGYGLVAAIVIVFVIGGKSYYIVGFYPPLVAGGAIVLDGWLGRGRRLFRGAVFGSAAAVSGALVALLVLPVLPPATLAETPIPSIYKESAEQVGWPELAKAVENAVATLPAADRQRAVVLTANYGEAGALELLGSGLPPVYSGHTGYWSWGPPPAGRNVVVLVGNWSIGYWTQFFGACRPAGSVDNGIGLDNQEQGGSIFACYRLLAPWEELWPRLRNLG